MRFFFPLFLIFSLAVSRGAMAQDALASTKTAYESMSAIDASSAEGRAGALAEFKEHFDFDGFYARVTPDIAAKMTPAENAQLKRIFGDLFFANFSAKTGSLAARKIEKPFYAVRETKPEHTVVTASGKFKGADAAISFFTRQDTSGKWKLIDLEVDSVLLSRNYRGSFNRVFREKGCAGLVERLQTKLKEFGAISPPNTPAK